MEGILGRLHVDMYVSCIYPGYFPRLPQKLGWCLELLLSSLSSRDMGVRGLQSFLRENRQSLCRTIVLDGSFRVPVVVDALG